MPYRQQLRALSGPLDVVVATPGRLIDHLHRGRLNLENVDVLILDEADRMLDMGFAEDVDLIAKACAPARQTMLFTATLDKRMSGLAARLLKEPARVAVDAKESSAAIDHRLYFTNHVGHKRRLLSHLASQSEVKKTIIFVATKRDCDTLAADLNQEGHSAAALHGDMDQNHRNHTMHRLRGTDLQFLVATDVAARGIDVRDISHVINFDLPRAAADYVHRIGRTGRNGATGIAISFAGGADRHIVRNIESFTRSKLTVHTVAGMEPLHAPRNDDRAPPRHGRPNFRHGGPGGHAGDGQGRDNKPWAGKPRGDRPWGKPRDGQPRDAQARDGQTQDGQGRDGQVRDGQVRDGQGWKGPRRDFKPRDGQPPRVDIWKAPARDFKARDGQAQDGQARDGQKRDGFVRDGKPRDHKAGRPGGNPWSKQKRAGGAGPQRQKKAWAPRGAQSR
jgi:superfamily II DNA/RNA helicase